MTELKVGMTVEATMHDQSGEPTITQDFHLVREIGRGGMGTIWLATSGEERFAIKFLNAEFAEIPQGKATPSGNANRRMMCRRFGRERDVLFVFDHPNIIRCFGRGELDDGEPFFVTEFHEGSCLGSEIYHRCADRGLAVNGRQRGTEESDFGKLESPVFSEEETVQVLREILGTFVYCHELGVWHRDIKPDNVMLTIGPEGISAIKVLDFGIAKVMGVAGIILGVADSTQLTQKGSFMGTPMYMSPEQLNGRDLDTMILSDIYAIGVLGFEMLTGRQRGISSSTLNMAELLTWNNDPGHYVKGLSQSLRAFIKKATATRIEDRFQSARDMRLALSKIEPQSAPRSDRSSRPSRNDTLSNARTIPIGNPPHPLPQEKVSVPKWIILGASGLVFLGGIGGLITSNYTKRTEAIGSADPSQEVPLMQAGLAASAKNIRIQASEASSKATQETSEQTFRLGAVYLGRGNIRDACEKFRQVQSLNPDYPGLKAKLAQCEK